MKQADKERNRLLLVKHIHTYTTQDLSKIHCLMLAMEKANKERNRLFMHGYNITIRKTYCLMFVIKWRVSRYGEKQVTTGHHWTIQ